MKYNEYSLSHAWMHKIAEQGKALNMYFEGDTIYSYGSHFPIASHNDKGVILYTIKEYSVTTSKHKSVVRSSIPRNHKVFYVPNVKAQSKSEHKLNYESYKERINEQIMKAIRARKYKELHLSHAAKLITEANEYTKLFKLGYRQISLDGFNLESIKEYDKKRKEIEKKRKAREDKERIKKNTKAIEAWKQGESNQIPYSIDKVYLRINGDNVETSKQASFPVSHVAKAWKLISYCVDSKKEWKRNGSTIRLGVYQIDSIDAKGKVIAGCHIVEYCECRRIATQLGLL